MPTTLIKPTQSFRNIGPKKSPLSIMPTQEEVIQAKDASSALSTGLLEVRQLPESIKKLLAVMLQEFSMGHGLSVAANHREVTSNQAADILNVSRPYLIRLIAEGKLPCHYVGSHRRIRLTHLLEYKHKQEAESEAALAALQAEAQEFGMGY